MKQKEGKGGGGICESRLPTAERMSAGAACFCCTAKLLREGRGTTARVLASCRLLALASDASCHSLHPPNSRLCLPAQWGSLRPGELARQQLKHCSCC
jgi:hypothetical protein